MLIVKLIRSLFGYVVFTGTGGFPERFLNLCVRYHIPLWDLQSTGTQFTGKTSVRAYKHIRPAAFRSGVRLRIVEKCGLPFFSARNRKRIGLVVGFAVTALLLAVLSGHIWSIEIVGNVDVPKAEIEQTVQSLGLHIGLRRSAVESEALADGLLREMPALSWAAVNVDSCKAVVEVREAIARPEILDTQTPSNVVAGEDGVLTALEVFSGTAALPVGSAVLKGDLLISGVVENADGSETLCGAQGKAHAQVEQHLLCTMPAVPFWRCAEVRTQKSLFVFGLTLPMNRSAGANPYRTEVYLSGGDTALPVGMYFDRSLSFAEGYTLSSENLRACFVAQRFAQVYGEIFCSGKICAEEIRADLTQEMPQIRGIVRYEKEIGINQEIFVEKISD